jgi:peptide deformylase
MIHKKVTQVGNPVIRARAKVISNCNTPEVRKIIKDLTDSMRQHELVGMAAPQIGKGVRVFVTEVRSTQYRKKHGIKLDELRVFINPKITSLSERMNTDWEGCGSVASGGLFGKVKIPGRLTVTAYNEKGELFSLEAHGLLARVIQHELDHLNGVVFVDKAITSTYMSRDEYLKLKYKK